MFDKENYKVTKLNKRLKKGRSSVLFGLNKSYPHLSSAEIALIANFNSKHVRNVFNDSKTKVSGIKLKGKNKSAIQFQSCNPGIRAIMSRPMSDGGSVIKKLKAVDVEIGLNSRYFKRYECGVK